jgi:arylformamidase
MEAMPFTATIGRAQVIDIGDSEIIGVPQLEPLRLTAGQRVLFKTTNSARCWKTDNFLKDYVYIAPEAAHYLAARRVLTVGVDYLSVGGPETGAETHRALLQAGIWIIESLNLENIEPGEYELVCLPLKIIGGDGAPARAVLRKLAA